MADATRRTHIVRISQDPPSDSYIDVEVLDAIAFRGEGGKEMIMSMENEKADACIKDDTGGGNGKVPGNPTRLSHMKRITNPKDPTQMLDVEVIDVVAFRDSNGDQWILDMKATTGEGPDVFDTTDGVGNSTASRRVHKEKISSPFGEKDPKQYLTIRRCDTMAFRSLMGKEMILKCPSSDDPNGGKRAGTVMTPERYDPANEDGPKPPENKDTNKYVAFVKDAKGCMTGDEPIMQGPLWWIRKVGIGGAYIIVTVTATNKSSFSPPPFPIVSYDLGDDPAQNKTSKVKLLDTVTQHVSTAVPPVKSPRTVYFVWNEMAPFPTVDNFDKIVWGSTGSSADGALYHQQFARFIWIWAGGTTTNIPMNNNVIPPMDHIYTGNGTFQTFEEAQLYAAAYNNAFADIGFEGRTHFGGYLIGDAGLFGWVSAGDPGPIIGGSMFAASLEIPSTSKPFYASQTETKYLFSIPTTEAVEKFTSDVSYSGDSFNAGSTRIFVQGYSDGKPFKVIADADGVEPDELDPDFDTYPNFGGLTAPGVLTVTQSVVAGLDPKVKAHRVRIAVSGSTPTNNEG